MRVHRKCQKQQAPKLQLLGISFSVVVAWTGSIMKNQSTREESIVPINLRWNNQCRVCKFDHDERSVFGLSGPLGGDRAIMGEMSSEP